MLIRPPFEGVPFVVEIREQLPAFITLPSPPFLAWLPLSRPLSGSAVRDSLAAGVAVARSPTASSPYTAARARGRGADVGVLGAGLDKAQEDLLPAQRDPQRDDHRVRGEPFAIQDQRDDVVAVQSPLLQRRQLAGGGPDVPPGNARPTQPKGVRHRLRGGPIVPAAQAVQNPPQHALIRRPRLLKPRVALEGNLDARLPV